MKKMLLIVAVLAPTVANAASDELTALASASQKALVVNWQCAEVIGLPALYEIQKTITISDMRLVGMSQSDAVIMVHDGQKKMEALPRATRSQEDVCRKLIDDARNELEYARAKFKKSAGLD